MHEFEFEVRNPDQIQTAKMAVGRHFEMLLEYYDTYDFNITNFIKNITCAIRGKQNGGRMGRLKSELAKLTPPPSAFFFFIA
jgi:hypothetical protein